MVIFTPGHASQICFTIGAPSVGDGRITASSLMGFVGSHKASKWED